MRFAIYDKASDAYLTKMVFEVGYTQHTQFECGLTEYIINAELLDTKEAANLAITRIEGTKFMAKGRFIVHSFDETLADQYVISEAGNPTKVVDNITVDLDGTINVKYGTMPLHWSTPYLIRAITRLNALQKAASDVYTHWNDTFDIYKVITVIDERGHNHYQFIDVTEKGLDSAKEEEKNLVVGKNITDVIDPLNKRIEELEVKVESIKKEARHWKTMYESALTDNNFPCISAAASELLKDINDIARAKKLANDIIDVWEADDKFEITLKKFSQLYEAVNDPSDDDDTIMRAFKGVLEIFSSLEDHVRDIIDESVEWKNKAIKAEKAKDDRKKLNEANVATIVRYRNEMRALDKENHEMRVARDCSAEIINAIRNAIANGDTNAFDCIESRMRHDPDFNSDPFMAGVRENVRDICNICYRNIENNNLKNSEIAKLTKERDKALEQKEFYKRQANSVYGMTLPCRCNGKQMFYDVTTGKKILVDKEKYDDIVERINNLTK